jgi:hypothetical protein
MTVQCLLAIVTKVNELPGVHLSGENYGQILPFVDLRNRLLKSRKQGKLKAWQNHNMFLQEEEVFCLAQQWFWRHTGSDCSENTIHGFKV